MSSEESEEPTPTATAVLLRCPRWVSGLLGLVASARQTCEICAQDPPEPVDPWVRGPNPSPGCWKLLGCFCTSRRRSIPPSRKAVHATVAYWLWGGLVEAGCTRNIFSVLLKALVVPGRGIYRSNREGRSNATSAKATC